MNTQAHYKSDYVYDPDEVEPVDKTHFRRRDKFTNYVEAAARMKSIHGSKKNDAVTRRIRRLVPSGTRRASAAATGGAAIEVVCEVVCETTSDALAPSSPPASLLRHAALARFAAGAFSSFHSGACPHRRNAAQNRIFAYHDPSAARSSSVFSSLSLSTVSSPRMARSTSLAANADGSPSGSCAAATAASSIFVQSDSSGGCPAAAPNRARSTARPCASASRRCPATVEGCTALPDVCVIATASTDSPPS